MLLISVLYVIIQIYVGRFFKDKRSKQKQWTYAIIEIVLYILGMISIYFLMFSWKVVIITLLLILQKTLTTLIPKLNRIKEKQYEIIYELLLLIIIYSFSFWNQELTIAKTGFEFIMKYPILDDMLRWTFAVLLLGIPANDIFRIIFSKFETNKGSKENSDNKAGRYIGILERLLYLIFIVLKQYAALGLIVTAKGYARHNSIVKKQNFAEYFIIGTLYSILVSFIVWGIAFYY